MAISWAWRPLFRPASLSGNNVAAGTRFRRRRRSWNGNKKWVRVRRKDLLANGRAPKQDFAAVSHRRTAVIAALITL